MPKLREKSKRIRQFILDNVPAHPADVASVTSNEFGLSRQAVSKHVRSLVNQGFLAVEGKARGKRYALRPIVDWNDSYKLDGTLEEDTVWRNDIAPKLNELPENVVDIWNYGFTEMLNNAIDHSSGSEVFVDLKRTAADVTIVVYDDGEGIFRKIQRELGLADENHAILELSKGKLTTDPAHHTGEGIFFSAQMFDQYGIISSGIRFMHTGRRSSDWILENKETREGTGVVMKLNTRATQTVKQVFDTFAPASGDYGFSKTIVPVRLARYGNEKLISRSQAKRVLVRVDRFETVLIDFQDVEMIGQAFADEIFRVFKLKHPEIEIVPLNANKAVGLMIARAQASSWTKKD